jgi:hypothetical protein
MSSGLTWISFVDSSLSHPDFNTGPIVFQNYNEAFAYAEWFLYNINIGGFPNFFQIFIYTTSPNPNGRFDFSGTQVNFIEL